MRSLRQTILESKESKETGKTFASKFQFKRKTDDRGGLVLDYTGAFGHAQIKITAYMSKNMDAWYLAISNATNFNAEVVKEENVSDDTTLSSKDIIMQNISKVEGYVKDITAIYKRLDASLNKL